MYGRPVSGGDDGDRSPDDDRFDLEAILGIIYCGFRAGNNDVRIPTARVFYLRRADIGESGEMADFVCAGEPVRYYDVPIAAEVRESTSKPVSLGAEMVRATGGTFASLAATPPSGPQFDPSELDAKTREELLALARGAMMEDVKMLGSCTGYCQTTKTTRVGELVKSDQWGGDCD